VSPGDKEDLHFGIAKSDFLKKRRAPCGTQQTSSHHNKASRIHTVKTPKQQGPSISKDTWQRSKLSGNFLKGKVINWKTENREIGDSMDKRFSAFRHLKL
jgi:hypothetical protein